MKRTNAAHRRLWRPAHVLFFVAALHAAAYAESPRAAIASAERLFLEGRYQDVVDTVNRLPGGRAADMDELYYLAGTSELKLARYGDARQMFQDIISEYPGCPRAFDAYLGLGDSYLLEGNAAAAVTVYENTLAAFPDHRNTPTVYYRLGEAYAKAGDADKAQYYFDSARLVAPLAFEAKAAPAVAARAVAQQKPASAAQEKPVSIQVASFRNKDNANNFVDRLSAEGFDSYAVPGRTPSGTVYRVRVGRFPARDDARSTVMRLSGRGYTPRICTDDLCE